MLSRVSLVPLLSLALCTPIGTFAQMGLSIADKVANLRVLPGHADRVKFLQDDEFVFDFLHPETGESDGAGGHTVAASSTNFPALVGTGMAMTIGFLEACGYNTPHTHPRATEFNFAVNGTLSAGFLAENGARFVFNDVPPGSAAIFPKGVIHFEMNNACEDMIFVAAFNDEDPGVTQIAQRFFGLPPAFVAASLGDIGIEQVAEWEAKIPNNIAQGTDECLKRCGLTRKTDQPTSQRQPRVAANALPSGFSGPPSAAVTTSTNALFQAPTSSSVASSTATSSSSSASSSSGNVSGGISVNDADGKPNPLIIGLIVAVAVLVIGYIILAVAFFVGRRNKRSPSGKYFRTGSDFSMPYESEKAFAPQRSTPYDPPSGTL